MANLIKRSGRFPTIANLDKELDSIVKQTNYELDNVIGTGGNADNGLPVGGTAGQLLSKIDATNYNTTWIDPITAAEIELQNTGTWIQWRVVGDVSWTNLIAVADITGADGTDGTDGKSVELQNSGTYIQWRLVGDVTWINLVALTAITGPAGTNGTDGTDGTDGVGVPIGGAAGEILAKIDSTNYNTKWIAPPTSYDDTEAQTYFAALGTPLSSGQQTLISNLVKTLKAVFNTNYLSYIFDVFYVLANETEEAAKLNLIKRSHDITLVNAPTWTQWQGYTGNGTTQYLNTNYNFNTQRFIYQLNTAGAGLVVIADSSSGTRCDMGVQTTGTVTELRFSEYSSNRYFRMNDAATYTMAITATKTGLFVVTRNAATFTTSYLLQASATTIATLSVNSVGFSAAGNVFILACNSMGSPADYSNKTIGIAFIGGYMSQREVLLMKAAIKTYLDAIGTTGIL